MLGLCGIMQCIRCPSLASHLRRFHGRVPVYTTNEKLFNIAYPTNVIGMRQRAANGLCIAFNGFRRTSGQFFRTRQMSDRGSSSPETCMHCPSKDFEARGAGSINTCMVRSIFAAAGIHACIAHVWQNTEHLWDNVCCFARYTDKRLNSTLEQN